MTRNAIPIFREIPSPSAPTMNGTMAPPAIPEQNMPEIDP